MTGLGFLLTIFLVSILGKDAQFFTIAPKTLTQSVIELITFFTSKDIFNNSALVSRLMVKAYFSPVIFVAPLILFLGPLRKKRIISFINCGFFTAYHLSCQDLLSRIIIYCIQVYFF